MCGDICNSKGGCGCSSGVVSVEQPFAREVEVLRFLEGAGKAFERLV